MFARLENIIERYGKRQRRKGKQVLLLYKLWNIFIIVHLFLGLKKDPGIPNLYPFKDQLLREIEERKQRVHTAFIYLQVTYWVMRRLRRPESGRKKLDVRNT